jgi:hypothetical protein
LAVRTLAHKAGVHVPQIRDFLTKAGEVLQYVWHASILTQILEAAGLFPGDKYFCPPLWV